MVAFMFKQILHWIVDVCLICVHASLSLGDTSTAVAYVLLLVVIFGVRVQQIHCERL